ncbi:MAG: 3'-5' exonuclease [Verrucomicrobiales bacterium]|nr:3'-5' exonuclease [Verrucomicrobiales bacterium]
MADVIPSSIPSNTPAGEQRLHAILEHLPTDCVAYHEPYIDGRVPDFVVLCPTIGILVIEVKDWLASRIHNANHDQVHLDVDGHFKSVTHPLRQARHYMHRLMDSTAKTRFATHFLHASGVHQGRFRFPFAHLTVLSNITNKTLEENRLTEFFPEKSTATRDTVDHWETLYPDELLDTLRSYFNPVWEITPLTANQINALRAIIHPEIYFDSWVSLDDLDASAQPLSEQLGVIKALDTRQENFAGSLGTGHRIIYGVAGSGKTLLLIAHAKRLTSENPDARILLTCYNQTLAASLRQTLARFPNVAVLSFHQIAAHQGIFPGDFDDLQPAQRDPALGEAPRKNLAGLDPSQKFDSILVDEAQDFEPKWFTALLANMKDPVNGALLIVADGSQGLYRRSKIAWSHLAINNRGGTTSARFHLGQNYRNSSEIIALAETFAHATEQTGITTPDDQIQAVRIDTSSRLRSTGAAPIFIHTSDRRSELAAAYRIAQRLLSGNWDGILVDPLLPSDIAILYPSAYTDSEKNLLRDFITGTTGHLAPAEWLSDPDNLRNRDRVSTPAIKLQSIHSSKGLQYRAVILVWTDNPPGPDPLQKRADRRLLYVALTRAESYLAITASKRSQFIDDLTFSTAIELRPDPQKTALFSTASVA